MRLLPRRFERPMYGHFNDLAAVLSDSSECLSRVMAQPPRDRRHLLPRLHENATRAGDLAHRISNQLVESLITPFEAEVLHGIAYAMADCVEHTERIAQQIEDYRLSRFSDALVQTAGIIERCTDLTVEAVWSLSTLRALDDYHREIRRLSRHARSLVRESLKARYHKGGASVDVLRERDIHEGLLELIREIEHLGRRADLLRVRDA